MMRAVRLVLVLVVLPSLVWGQTQVINGNRVHAGWVNYGTTGGTATAYTLTFTPALAGYVAGQCFLVKPHVTNMGAATLNVQGKGPLALTKLSGGSLVPLVAGDLPLNRLMQACYDGTDLQLMGTAPDASSGGVTDADKGDITVSLGGTDWRIDPGAVTYSKLQATTAPSVVLGRGDASAGPPQELSLGSGLAISGTTLSVTAGGGNVSSSGTPADNRVAVWTSPSQIEGTTGLTYSGGILGVGTGGALGKLAIAGNTSGVVTVQPQAAAGTYNLNLPTSAGANLQVLTSGGGGTTPMLWTTLAPSATTDTTNAANVTSGTLAADRLPPLSASRLLGRGSGGAGVPQEISLGPGLSMSGTTLNTVSAAEAGIVCDGATMVSTAIQTLLDNVPVGTTVVLPGGDCRLNSSLTIARSIGLRGAGQDLTYLKQTVTNLPVLTVTALFNVHVTGMTLMHTTSPVAGGDGLIVRAPTGGSQNSIWLTDVSASWNWRGFVLGCVAYGYAGQVVAQKNNSHGFQFMYETDPGCGVDQWDVVQAVSLLNVGAGFYGNNTVYAFGLGPFIWNASSFGNNLGGYLFQGSTGHPINDIRIHNVLSSADNGPAILLDTYGGSHIIENPWIEYAGSLANFPIGFNNTASVARNTGHCLEITANNGATVITGGIYWNCSWSGVALNATGTTMTGGISMGSGQALDGAAARRAGITIGGAQVLVSGHSFLFPGAGTLSYIHQTGPGTTAAIGLNTYAPELAAPRFLVAQNQRGQVSIADTATTATVTLTPAEPNSQYFVQLTPVATTAGAPIGANTITGVTKTTGSFEVSVATAPGTGRLVVYDWLVYR